MMSQSIRLTMVEGMGIENKNFSLAGICLSSGGPDKAVQLYLAF